MPLPTRTPFARGPTPLTILAAFPLHNSPWLSHQLEARAYQRGLSAELVQKKSEDKVQQAAHLRRGQVGGAGRRQ